MSNDLIDSPLSTSYPSGYYWGMRKIYAYTCLKTVFGQLSPKNSRKALSLGSAYQIGNFVP
jgi:hypothetical protein